MKHTLKWDQFKRPLLVLVVILLAVALPFVSATSLTQNSQVGIDNTVDADNVLDTAAAGTTTSDLYWGNDLLCDSSATNCGWGDANTGTGAANHIAIWTGASTLSYDNGQLYWDISNNELGIGTNGPDSDVHVVGSVCVDTDGVCTDPGDGNIVVFNYSTPDASRLPHIILDSTNSGDTWTDQGAYIVLGESASSGAAAALYLTYVGNGWGYVGSGGGVFGAADDGIPDQSWWAFDYDSDSIYTQDDIGIGDSIPDADLMVVGGVCIDSDTSCTDPGDGSLYVEEDVELHGTSTNDAIDLNISSANAVITLGIGQSGPHGLIFGDSDAGAGISMLYRTTGQSLVFEAGDSASNGANIMTIDSDTSHVGIGVSDASEDTELHVVGGVCVADDDTCTDPGAGNIRLEGGTLEGAGGEQILIGASDDYIEFQGRLGTDNTDLRFDLDGSYPIMASPTDTSITIDDSLATLGLLTISGNLAWDGELSPDSDTCSSNQGVRRTGADNWDCISMTDGSGSANRVVYWSDSNTFGADADFYWDSSNNRLGLGQSSPSAALHVEDTSFPQVNLSYDGDDYVELSRDTRALYHYVNGVLRMTIEEDQDIAFGADTSPGADLTVIGGTCIDDDSACTDPGDGSLTLSGDLYFESSASLITMGSGQAGPHNVVFGDNDDAMAIEYTSSSNQLAVINYDTGENILAAYVDDSGRRVQVNAHDNGINTGVYINGDGNDPDTAIYIPDSVSYGLRTAGTIITGIYVEQADTYGIYGQNWDSSGTEYGVRGYNTGGSTGYGGYFQAVSATTNRGVYGSAPSTQCSFYTPDSSGGYCSGSSYKWKRNIKTLTDAVDRVQEVRGVTYNLDNFDDVEFGFIAEEIYKVYPSVVSLNEEGEPTALDAHVMFPMLVEAAKDQQVKIEDINQGFESKELFYHGDVLVSGGLGVVQPDVTDSTKEIVYYGLVGPEKGTYHSGVGNLVSGMATINLPSGFSEVTDSVGITVVVAPRSSSSLGLAVTFADNTRLEVTELNSGTGSYQFDYTVYGVRQLTDTLEENVYFVPHDGYDLDYLSRNNEVLIANRLESNGILSGGNFNAAVFDSLGWMVPIEEPQIWDDTPQNPADVSEFTNEGIHPADYYQDMISDDPGEDITQFKEYDRAEYEAVRKVSLDLKEKWEEKRVQKEERKKSMIKQKKSKSKSTLPSKQKEDAVLEIK